MTFFVKILFVTLLLAFCSQASAATYINFTRLILNENEREVTFRIKNEGDNAVLMQLWTDRDNFMDKPESIKTPFMILPPVFRLNGMDSRTARLQLIDNEQSLPKNKESLFWLNALEIPQKTKGTTDEVLLQVAFRTRIKIFYRPVAISQINTEKEVEKIKAFKVNCDNGECIRLENRTPFHYSLLKISLSSGKEIIDLPQDGLLFPFSSLDIPSEKIVLVNESIKSFTWIDDYGVERISLK
jgi:P pilus assembly chaperone PapD